jgi:radical SAM superfamily enzyme YgiQ (UPF0313 family)
MKVCLINPGLEQASEAPPLNLAILASYLLEHGHEVKIVDMLSGDYFPNIIEQFKPDFVGVTGTTPVVPYTYRVADFCREKGIFTIIGGVHPSILPNEAAKHADAVVVGEGETALLDIINNKKRGIIQGEALKDINILPIPSYESLNMDFYLSILQRQEMCFCSFAPRDFKVAAIVTSRGCPYSCTFCHNSYRDLPYRYRSPENVVKEVKHLIDNFGVNAVFFCDDNFFVNEPRVKKICELFKSTGISKQIIWGANGRVNNINKNILQLVKDVNCKQVTFGWESGSQKTLDSLNKQTTVDQNHKSIEMCNEIGINAAGTFMIGNPNERIEDLEKTKKFIQNHHITGGIGICISTPYPGTKMWDWCKENNKIPNDLKWKDFDYHHVPIKMYDMDTTEFLKFNDELVAIAINKFVESRQERLNK